VGIDWVVFQILVRNQFFVGGNGNKKKKKASLYKLFGTHPKKVGDHPPGVGPGEPKIRGLK